jgi:hypothetical protein
MRLRSTGSGGLAELNRPEPKRTAINCRVPGQEIIYVPKFETKKIGRPPDCGACGRSATQARAEVPSRPANGPHPLPESHRKIVHRLGSWTHY